MTAVTRADRPSGTVRWAAPILGCALLLLRPVGGVATPERLAALAATAVAVAALGLGAPAPAARLPPSQPVPASTN